MRKLLMVVALVVMLVPMFAVVAVAADQIIYGKAAPCYGTGNDDKIYERPRNAAYDKIIMKGGHDIVLANAFRNDTDVVQGGKGYDKINVADGDTFDTASGGHQATGASWMPDPKWVQAVPG